MNSSESWDIKVDQAVYKQLKRIPLKFAKDIVSIIEDSHFDPYSGDIRKVKGEQYVWAHRVGEYRIFYEVYQSSRTVNVYNIERKTSQSYK